jgi:dihydrofolate reductase
MPRLPLIAVVARARNGVIGMNNKMPWHLPEDLQHFRRLTTGYPVIMGRKTFESIGRPLPDRKMIVLSRSKEQFPDYVHLAKDLNAAIALCAGHDKAFVIGGAQIYRQALAHCVGLVITDIELDTVGDAWFAEPSPQDWIRVDRQECTSKSGLNYAINTYRKREEHEGEVFA